MSKTTYLGAAKGLGVFRKSRRATRIFRQTGRAFCLDAVVQSLCAHYKLPIPAGHEIRKLADTTAAGASVAGAIKALESVGFLADAGFCNYKQLQQLDSPAIAIINRSDGSLHYVIVNQARYGKVEMLDPAGATIQSLSQSSFEAIWTRTLLLISPRPKAAFDLDRKPDPVRWIRNAIWKRRPEIVTAVVAMLFQTVLILLSLWLLKELLAGIRNSVQEFQIYGIIVGFTICALLRTLFLGGYESIRTSLKKGLALELEIQSTEQIQKSDLAYLKNADCHELAKSCRGDAVKIGAYFAAIVDAIVQIACALALLLCLGVLDDFGFVFVFVGVLTIVIPVCSYFPLQTQFYLQRKQSEASELVQKQLSENLAGIQPLRRHKAASARMREVRRRQIHAFRISEQLENKKTQLQVTSLVAGSLLAALVLFLSCMATPDDSSFIICKFILANLITLSLRRFSLGIANFPELVYHVRRLQDLVFSVPQSTPKHQSKCNAELAGHELTFQDIGQSSDNELQPVFANFNLMVRQGQSVQLIDESGVRNQQLKQWLYEQVPVECGRIRIDGLDVRDLQQAQLRKVCGFCPADPYIFQTELINNICPGNQALCQHRLNDIVDTVGLRSLVEKLPQRLETVIGKSGMFTTWAERFRIGLARLAVLDPPIVIIELPKYRMTDSLNQSLNGLLQSYWNQRIVLILANQNQPDIECANSYRIDQFGQQIDLEKEK